MPTWKRILLAAIGIPALVLGLFAMHALTSDSSTPIDSHVVAEVLADPSAGAEADSSAAAIACDEVCATAHDLLTASCVLGLFLALMLLLPAAVPSWGDAARRLAQTGMRARGLIPTRTASLELLSISRI